MKKIHYETTVDILNARSAQCRMYRSAQKYIADQEDHNAHTDNYCEIYVNISGNVAFMVENTIYPISSGDIIITNPNEYHCCIYLSNCYHDHYVLWVPQDGNEELLRHFLDRKPGKHNLISPSEQDKKRFQKYCQIIVEKQEETTRLEKFSALVTLLSIIDKSFQSRESENHETVFSHVPSVLVDALNYINVNYKTIRNIRAVADTFYISHNTLDRLFKKYLNTTPSRYIEEKRFANAKQMLNAGRSITEACYESGFADYSHFISKFKKTYGLTPMGFQKGLPDHDST